MRRKTGVDFQDEVHGLAGDLAGIRSGVINKDDALNELQALIELMKMMVDDLSTWTRHCDEAQKLKFEAAIFGAWPLACRRAGVPVGPFPSEVLKKLNPSTPN